MQLIYKIILIGWSDLHSPSTFLLAGNSTVYWIVTVWVSPAFSSSLHSTLFWVLSLGLGGGAPCFCLGMFGSTKTTWDG